MGLPRRNRAIPFFFNRNVHEINVDHILNNKQVLVVIEIGYNQFVYDCEK